MKANQKDWFDINLLIQNYFEGLHNADIDKLKSIFDSGVVLTAPGLRRPLNEWLKLVASRDIPKQCGFDFNYKIISIEIFNDQAMVKVLCPLLNNKFIDYLGLLKEKNKWVIVTKMYSDYSY